MVINDKVEKLLWSIALPGFGQILNKEYIKGIFFIALEFLINIKSNLNMIIFYSFLGNTEMAIRKADFEWLLFYPCLYTFAAWDAFKNAKGEVPPFSFLPFFITAILATIGTIYSSFIKIFGLLIGPVWIMILCALIGGAAGIYIMKFFSEERV